MLFPSCQFSEAGAKRQYLTRKDAPAGGRQSEKKDLRESAIVFLKIK